MRRGRSPRGRRRQWRDRGGAACRALARFSVGPIELVENPVGFLGTDRHARGGGSEGALAAFTLLPDEACRQVYLSDVVLACHRILQGLAAAFPHSLDAERALLPAFLDGDLGFHQPRDHRRRSQNLPRHAAEGTREDLSERFDLLFGGGWIHHEGDLTIALVDRFRPIVDSGTLHAREVYIAAFTPS